MAHNNLKFSINEAFIGHITNGFRAIAYDVSKSNIIIYVYLDREPTETDYEIVDYAVTEILASNPEILYQKIELIQSHLPIQKLNSYLGWIFMRFEN